MIELRWVCDKRGKNKRLQYRFRQPTPDTSIAAYPPKEWAWADWREIETLIIENAESEGIMNAHDTPCRVAADLRKYEAEQDAAMKRGDAFDARVAEIERGMGNSDIAYEILEGNAIDDGCVEILTMVLNAADMFYKCESEGHDLLTSSMAAFKKINLADVAKIASKAKRRYAEAQAESEWY